MRESLCNFAPKYPKNNTFSDNLPKMLSKNKQKVLRQLSSKKHRDESGLFIAEGPKVVGDLLGAFPCQWVLATAGWLSAHRDVEADEVIEITQHELEQISLLKTPRDVLAVFRRQETAADVPSVIASAVAIARSQLTIALDGVQDPGNMGTILRIADWFGIEHVFCSPDTADAFSPKTIQATMGAIARVQVHYLPLPRLLEACGGEVPVYGTFLDGTDMYAQELSAHGIIVMGNEGNGISDEVSACINRRLFIPSFPADRETSESLNVAIATAITCAEFRRRR